VAGQPVIDGTEHLDRLIQGVIGGSLESTATEMSVGWWSRLHRSPPTQDPMVEAIVSHLGKIPAHRRETMNL